MLLHKCRKTFFELLQWKFKEKHSELNFLSLLTFMHNWVVYLLVSHIISLTFVVIENILNIFLTNIFSDSGGEKKDKKKAKEAEKEGLNR
jgi:hypothetical protein